jgi:hypothetical protein
MIRFANLLVLMTAAACSHATKDSNAGLAGGSTFSKADNREKSRDTSKKESSTAMPSVTAKLTGVKPGQPPMKRLQLEVQIHNSRSEALWFVIPSSLPGNRNAVGVDSLRMFQAGAEGLATFLGGGGFHLTKVAANSSVSITNLEVMFFNDEPGSTLTSIEIQSADDLLIGKDSISKWMTSAVASGTSLDASVRTSKATAWDHEQKVEFVSGVTQTIPVTKN